MVWGILIFIALDVVSEWESRKARRRKGRYETGLSAVSTATPFEGSYSSTPSSNQKPESPEFTSEVGNNLGFDEKDVAVVRDDGSVNEGTPA